MVRWMMEKRGTMAVKERHVEREKERNSSGRSRLEGKWAGRLYS